MSRLGGLILEFRERKIEQFGEAARAQSFPIRATHKRAMKYLLSCRRSQRDSRLEHLSFLISLVLKTEESGQGSVPHQQAVHEARTSPTEPIQDDATILPSYGRDKPIRKQETETEPDKLICCCVLIYIYTFIVREICMKTFSK